MTNKKGSLLDKILSNFVSVKFYIVVTATIFFANGKLSEPGWKEVVLIAAGIRSIDKFTSAFQKGKPDGS